MNFEMRQEKLLKKLISLKFFTKSNLKSKLKKEKRKLVKWKNEGSLKRLNDCYSKSKSTHKTERLIKSKNLKSPLKIYKSKSKLKSELKKKTFYEKVKISIIKMRLLKRRKI